MVKQTYLGFTLIVFATLSYAVANILLKIIESELSHGLVVFYRFFFSLLLLLPTLYLRKTVSLKTQNLKLILLRGTTGFLMILCWTYALKFLPTATVILLTNTSPLFVPIILFLLWREKVSLAQVVVTGVGFFGIVFILHPDYHSWCALPSLVGLCSGLLLAIGLVTMRQLTHTEPSIRIVTYFYLIGILYSLIFFKLHMKSVTIHDYLLLLAIAIATTGYQLLITKSLAYLSPLAVSPLFYMAVVFGCIGDYLFWHIVPTVTFFIGLGLIFFSVLLNIFFHREQNYC